VARYNMLKTYAFWDINKIKVINLLIY